MTAAAGRNEDHDDNHGHEHHAANGRSDLPRQDSRRGGSLRLPHLLRVWANGKRGLLLVRGWQLLVRIARDESMAAFIATQARARRRNRRNGMIDSTMGALNIELHGP